MVQKGSKKRPGMGSKRHQNDLKMMPKRCQNDPGSTPKMVPKWSQNYPISIRIGSTMAQKRSKRSKVTTKPVKKKSSKPSQKCMETLKSHSGSFQIHPLTAHFHRQKRRIWPFFKQNKCFYRRKWACFCTILVNFGRNLHILPSLESFCLILQSPSQNITKKPQNDRKNGLKTG